MGTGEVLDKAIQYAMVIRTALNPKKVVLYGSYAKGTAHDDSDIDIAVICDKVDDDYLEKAVQLYKLRGNIDERIEPVLLEEGNDSSGFMEEILKTGKIIYSRS